MAFVAPHCRCTWRGVPCAAAATQEDGLCDWCGVRRPEQMRDNPFAMFGPNSEYLGLGGGSVTPYNHQAGRSGIPDDAIPSACWAVPASPPDPWHGAAFEGERDD
jgi:hypothetical protein